MGSVMWLVGHKVSQGVDQGVSHGAGQARSMHREQSWNYAERFVLHNALNFSRQKSAMKVPFLLPFSLRPI